MLYIYSIRDLIIKHTIIHNAIHVLIAHSVWSGSAPRGGATAWSGQRWTTSAWHGGDGQRGPQAPARTQRWRNRGWNPLWGFGDFCFKRFLILLLMFLGTGTLPYSVCGGFGRVWWGYQSCDVGPFSGAL